MPGRSAWIVFIPKFGKKNEGTRSFQECVIKKLIRCESVLADLDVMSESAILSADLDAMSESAIL